MSNCKEISAILILTALILITGCGVNMAQKDKDYLIESKIDKDARMKWWRDARFGMFIHWGAYSVMEGYYKDKDAPSLSEWIMFSGKVPVAEYEQIASRFNPVYFNANEWVRVAKQAGMKYIVITSKHHDGFCLWDSDVTDYDIIDHTPFDKDILKELSVACKDQGVKLCFYHSIMDWHHPNAKGENWPKYRDEYMKPQLKEIVTRYDPAAIWFDGEWIKEWTEPQGKELYNYLRNLNPDLIINNRVGKGRQAKSGILPEGYTGDFGTPEQEIPATGLPDTDWESCMTLFHDWGYHRDYLKWLKPSEYYIQQLIDIASKGGNLLLNIGPMANGLFPEPCVQRFSDMGSWMAINSESIYGTKASPFKKLSWGRCTQKEGKLYLHVFDWPEDGVLVVPGLMNEVEKAYLLGGMKGNTLSVTREGQDIHVNVPGKMESPATVVVLDIQGAPDVVVKLIEQSANGLLSLTAENADIHGSAKVESKGGKNNIGFWTDANTYLTWKFKLTTAGQFEVFVDFASTDNSSGSDYTVAVGGKELAGKVKSTGAWDKYETVTLGIVKLDEAASYELCVKPKNKPGLGVMNLRSIQLRPIKQ